MMGVRNKNTAVSWGRVASVGTRVAKADQKSCFRASFLRSWAFASGRHHDVEFECDGSRFQQNP